MTVDEVLTAVATYVPYLRASTTTVGDGWLACEALVADAEVLRRVVEGTKAGFETDDSAVAASLFAQAYAFRVSGAALAAYALDLPFPDVAPAATAVRIDKPRPTAVAHLSPSLTPPDPDRLSTALLDGHLRRFVDAAHGAFRVGERLLWGDVSASCAAVLRAVESSGAHRGQVRDRSAAFMAAAAPWFDGLGAFTIVQHAGHEGWYWDRSSCCLWFRTANGGFCDNCSLIDGDDLHTRRMRELEERAS